MAKGVGWRHHGEMKAAKMAKWRYENMAKYRKYHQWRRKAIGIFEGESSEIMKA
jgi:hypothetical protein